MKEFEDSKKLGSESANKNKIMTSCPDSLNLDSSSIKKINELSYL